MTHRIRIVSFLTILFLFSGCTRKEQAATTTKPTSPVSDNIAEVVKVEQRANKVPNFSWKDRSGNITDFDSYRGNVTLINFWATWCGPCKKELPDLIALSKELSNRGVKFIGVSTDRGGNVVDDVRAFAQKQGMTYQIVVANEEMEEAFGNIRAIPTSFIIDREGKIAQSIVGMRSKEFFAGAITAVLQ